MEFTKPQALNDSLVEIDSDTEETKDRGSDSSSSAQPAPVQPNPIEKTDEPEKQQ